LYADKEIPEHWINERRRKVSSGERINKEGTDK